jgi:hypothetical protein
MLGKKILWLCSLWVNRKRCYHLHCGPKGGIIRQIVFICPLYRKLNCFRRGKKVLLWRPALSYYNFVLKCFSLYHSVTCRTVPIVFSISGRFVLFILNPTVRISVSCFLVGKCWQIALLNIGHPQGIFSLESGNTLPSLLVVNPWLPSDWSIFSWICWGFISLLLFLSSWFPSDIWFLF